MEKVVALEKLPCNHVAREIGQILILAPDINRLNKLKEPYDLKRINEVGNIEDIPYTHQNKRHIFWATILGQETVLLHFSDALYCQDPNYFWREYRDCRNFYSGQMLQSIDRKLSPSLLGHDDKTMTLIIERAPRDLSFFFDSTNEKELKQIIEASIDLFKYIWESTKEENKLHPRFVRTFLAPEYFFIKGKRVEDYLKNRQLIALYKQTQRELSGYLTRLGRFRFQRGFGLPDVKPTNLVEDKEGNVLFIDVSKPEFAYHWLNQLGQLYQGATKEAQNSLFTRILKERAEQTIKSFSEPELSIGLFALGRMNRLLICCTLRNIVYGVEIGQSIDDKMIRASLIKVKNLINVSSANEVTR